MVAALLVGVRGAAEEGGAPLKYAAADVTELAQHLSQTVADSSIRVLVDSEATPAAVSAALADMAGGAAVDLTIVMFCAHGYVDEHGASGILLSGDRSTCRLSASAISERLDDIPSANLLCILDCCYAEAVAAQMSCFRALGNSRARLYIASSRASQLTWEDDGVRHGVFTAFLLDALHGATKGVNRDALEVQSELFPFLRAQVPLYVLTRKGHGQEPVIGGSASDPLWLPTGAARAYTASTPLRTALRRVRQILVGLLAAALASLLITYGTAYYAELSDDGEVVLRNGVRSLAAAYPLGPHVRVKTGIGASEISADPRVSYPFYAGLVRGVWSHVDASGVRSWAPELMRVLDEPRRYRFAALLGLKPSFLDAEEKGFVPGWKVEAAGLHALIAPSNSKAAAEYMLQHVPGRALAVLPQSINDPHNFDFSVIDLRPSDYLAYANGIWYLAEREPDAALELAVRLASALQHKTTRRGHQYDMAVMEAVGARLGGALRRVFEQRPEAAGKVKTALEAADLFQTLGYATSAGAPSVAANLGLDRLAVEYVDGLGSAGPSALRALMAVRAVALHADSSPRARQQVDSVYLAFKRLRRTEEAFLSRFLADAARRGALGPEARRDLIHELSRLRDREPDFKHLDLARILAGSLNTLEPDEAALVVSVMGSLLNSSSSRSELLAQAFSNAGHAKRADDAMLRHAEESAAKALGMPDRIARPTEFAPGAVIAAGSLAPWVATLADLAADGYGSPRRAELLLGASRRSDMEIWLPSIARGLPLRDIGPAAEVAGRHVERMRGLSTDSRGRKFAALQLGAWLGRQPAGRRAEAESALRSWHANEVDVELRLAMAAALVAAYTVVPTENGR
jgi:hypothetical protein